MKKIAVVSGTRAEYGILRSVLNAIKEQKGLTLMLVVTGMHLSHEFGYTVSEIEKDGFKIDARVDMMATDDTATAMAKSVGQGIIGMAQAWERLKPDAIVVLGDRVEPLAAVISGAYMNIPIAHIHGGDATRGGLDEYARHAITKLSNIHFPATEKSAERIIKMGEDKWRVHVVGSPALDTILNEPLIRPGTIAKKYNVDLDKPLILLIQHAVSTESDMAAEQIRETLEAIVEIRESTIVIYPNSDAGGRRMITVIDDYVKKYPFIRAFPSLPRREYLSLLKIAGVLAGNSSSGIIDAPSFGIPVVNIGTRQEGRERSCNVIDVDNRKEAIVKAVKKALFDSTFIEEVKKCKNLYGDGHAGIKIAKILSGIDRTARLLQKKITY
jgi:GDP/UDP-N,N'-diacetylbacillosamine 2-epimerase (hydrolysing)